MTIVWRNSLLASKAFTKIQSLILVAVIIIALVGGAAVYIILSEQNQPDNMVRIGILADLDSLLGKHIWQGAVLAAEQINAEGGLLGKNIEVIGEDHDLESETDMIKVNSALIRLITYNEVDFVIGDASGDAEFVCQEIVAEHKKIFLSVMGNSDDATQRVLDEYDKYKYYFRVWPLNTTSMLLGMTDSLLGLREKTGFNKIGYLGEDLAWSNGVMDGLDYVLPAAYGFDVVYRGSFPLGTVDFSSYFAAAEAAEVEVLLPLIRGDSGIPFVKEWYDRQSPMFIFGGALLLTGVPESWDWTGGKCEDVVTAAMPISIGYPLTAKTLPTREAYRNRWDETPQLVGAAAYDALRFILSDAINRAQTIETSKVIESLEETSIETSQARNFVFTSSHDVMMGENPNDPDMDYTLVMLFQWQNGELVPVYPEKIMEEARVTLTFPDWLGPWD